MIGESARTNCSSFATKFPEDVQRTYDRICEVFSEVVFTGSRAMGVETESSDWDFVVSDVLGSETKIGIEDLRHGESVAAVPGFTSIRIDSVNLIIDHRDGEVLASWAAATDYCAERMVADKAERIKIFEQFGV